MTVFTRRRALALGSGALLLPSPLRAQAAWPTSPVTFVVGYAPCRCRKRYPHGVDWQIG